MFTGKSTALTDSGIAQAAASLHVTPAEIWAILTVETAGCGFLPDRRPQLLFERHYFHRLTGGQYADPDISAPTPGGYGPAGAHQYDRLARALALDRPAALQSASWGIGQIMGANFQLAGFPDVETMITAMVDSEDAQLAALSSFVRVQSPLANALKTKDWTTFARLYNGPAYAANAYDSKLAQAFTAYQNGTHPNSFVRAAQLYLTFRGFRPGPIDGIAGAHFHAALADFQREKGLSQSEELDLEILQPD